MTAWRAGRFDRRSTISPGNAKAWLTYMTCCRDIFPCRLVGRKGASLPVTYTAHTTTLDLAQHR